VVDSSLAIARSRLSMIGRSSRMKASFLGGGATVNLLSGSPAKVIEIGSQPQGTVPLAIELGFERLQFAGGLRDVIIRGAGIRIRFHMRACSSTSSRSRF
jgi:hypothetical protein